MPFLSGHAYTATEYYGVCVEVGNVCRLASEYEVSV